jgi:hypothetical protein
VFDLIFLTLIIGGWLIAATFPWFVLSIATRGRAGLGMLPLCAFAGVVGAFAVPILGADDGNGLKLSFAVAIMVSTVLLALRRFSLGAPQSEARRRIAADREEGDRV